MHEPSSRRRGPFDTVDYLLKDSTRCEPLDETEQEEVVVSFEDRALAEQRTWKRLFGAGTVALALFFLSAAVRQVVEPYGVRYTGELTSVTSHVAVVSVLALQGCALALVAASMLTGIPQRGERARICLPPSQQQQLLLRLGGVGCAVGAAYWGHALYAMIRKHGYEAGQHWELLWLPAAPLALALLCGYVTSVLKHMGQQVMELRKMKYRHKRL